MRTQTLLDEVVVDPRVLHFFRALAVKEQLLVRFAANSEQLDLETLQIAAFVDDPTTRLAS